MFASRTQHFGSFNYSVKTMLSPAHYRIALWEYRDYIATRRRLGDMFGHQFYQHVMKRGFFLAVFNALK